MDVETLGKLIGGIVVGAGTVVGIVIAVLGKLVSRELRKTIDGDGNGNKGLRQELKEIGSSVQSLGKQQAVVLQRMDSDAEARVERQKDLDRRLEEICTKNDVQDNTLRQHGEAIAVIVAEMRHK